MTGAPPGAKHKYDLKVKNDSDAKRDVRVVMRDDDLNSNYKVKFVAGGQNITDAVIYTGPGDGLGKAFKNIKAGKSAPTIRGTIKAKDTAPPVEVIELELFGWAVDGDVQASAVFADRPHVLVTTPSP